MAEGSFKRKLAAVFSADVVGYSRLMGEDETATVKTLELYKGVMSELIRQHRGRVVDSPGDNMLAEFASVVDAVQCAVAAQNEFKARNTELPENRKMQFRVGVNLGDVIEERERIYGDGVNIAARLEALADPGGICVSKTAFDHIETKLPLGYEFLGEQEVKNIAKPVGAYRVLMDSRVTVAVTGKGVARTARGAKRKRAVTGLVGALVVVMSAVTVWQFVIAPKPTAVEKADPQKMALPLPDLPSIAVLPFVNMSEDPKQGFFCDGMTEEIITALSKVPRLFVIARDSTFTYKGKPVKVKQVSEALGVRYVLEGSVQRSADRIRITAQLIDALTGHHLWAERYDRELKDIFALRDEIIVKILMATRVKLTEGEQASGIEKYFKGKQGLDCYLKIMEGNDLVERRNIKDNNLARRIAEEVLAMCPEVPMAYLLMANVHSRDYWVDSSRSPQESIEKGIEMVQEALALDDNLSEAHGLLGYLYTQKREYEKGIAQGERAVALNPSGAAVLGNYARSLNFAGRSEETIPLLQKAIRLNPVGSYDNYTTLGNALMFTGQYEEAVSAYKKAIQRAPNNVWHHIMLAATYSMMGREKEARAEVEEALRINPKLSLDFWAKTSLIKEKSVKEKIFNALREAGLK
jgi:adenylate cyclase